MTQLILPFPPSVNHYWKHKVQGRFAKVYLSDEAKAFRNAVKIACIEQKSILNASDRVKVEITLHAPNKRKFDIDNRVKGVLDALTHAGVWSDDEQVDELIVRRGDVLKEGKAVVVIRAI